MDGVTDGRKDLKEPNDWLLAFFLTVCLLSFLCTCIISSRRRQDLSWTTIPRSSVLDRSRTCNNQALDLTPLPIGPRELVVVPGGFEPPSHGLQPYAKPSQLQDHGDLGGIRTHNTTGLSRSPLPLGYKAKCLVGVEGFEPPRLSTPVPKTSAAANYATPP